jgi:uncharacterized protein (TIGR03435 family)
MKRTEKGSNIPKFDGENLEEVLHHYLRPASQEQVDTDCGQVLSRLEYRAVELAQRELITDDSPASLFIWPRRAALSAAAVILVAIGITILLQQYQGVAMVRVAEGTLYRLVDGKLQDVLPGRTLDYGQMVRANDAGSVLVLADTSRVEMRPASEFSIDRAGDGIRINLSKGGVIVSAAKQRGGHLYVRTKDMTVSVVGTVFLVNAEEEGSRVAVIEGEVRLQQGAVEQKLGAGELVATNPQMEWRPVKQEIGWSRHVEAHMALFQASARQIPVSERVAFEAASIRARERASGGGRGGNGGITVLPNGCSLIGATVDPRRFAAQSATVYTLIAWAYGANFVHPLTGGCPDIVEQDLITGGPGWTRSDLWDIEAVIPAGSPSYTEAQLRKGQASQLQRMILSLLEERFNLVVRRETKQVAAYALTAGEGPRFVVAQQVFPGGRDNSAFRERWERLQPGSVWLEGPALCAKEGSIADLIPTISRYSRRPILDRTGISRPIDFCLMFTPENFGNGLGFVTGGVAAQPLPSLSTALEEQMGLKLEDTKTSVDVWVIESVAKPSDN